jgi:hypothetical protein
MSYRDLYEYCQNLPIPVSRRELTPNVCRLAGKPEPRVIMRDFNPEIVRGLFVVPGESGHPHAHFVRGPGGALIYVAREMNYCWKRFVEVKELMHHFDTSLQLVGTDEEFASLIAEFVGPSPERSEAFKSESVALWMALGVLCPEQYRQEFSRQRMAGEIDDLEIARQLKIPQRYVPHLFNPHFRRYIELIR